MDGVPMCDRQHQRQAGKLLLRIEQLPPEGLVGDTDTQRGNRSSEFCRGGTSLTTAQGVVKGDLTTVQRDGLA